MRVRVRAFAERDYTAFARIRTTGEQDRTTTPRAAHALHEGIAGSSLVVLPGVGHMGFVETPEPYIEAVTTFLHGATG